jgi:hypothetical protein
MDAAITHGTMKLGHHISQQLDIPFYLLLQAHLWYDPFGDHRLKEPTNEELSMLAGVSIAHGVRGIQWFWYDTWGSGFTTNDDYGVGLTDFDGTLRTTNAYGQPKAQHLADINATLEKWGPYVMSFNDDDRKVAIYRNEVERESFLYDTYFSDVVTYKPGSGNPVCPVQNDNPNDGNPPPGYVYECNENRYLQTSVFENDSAHTKYFMIVNRRCSPYDPPNENGGHRKVKVRFDNDHTAFAGFNNWKIIDVEDYSTVAVFNKSNSGLVDLDDFLPGEGRLYKIAPVMQEGGTFVTNESVGQDVICKDTVYNDGYNLTIPIGRTIEFKENVKVEMNGGSFFCCLQGGTPTEDDVLLKGHGNELWNGFQFTDCDTVKIDNTIIQNIENYDPPHTFYAFDVVNCDYVKISESAFTGYNTGAVRSTYTSGTGVNILINANIFSMNNNHSPVIAVYGNSAITLPVVIDNNNFTVSSSSSSQAIVASNISGAVIKNNDITNYYQSIVAFSSSIDLYNNTIITSSSEYGISGSSGSSLGLRPPGGKLSAGFNTVSTSHEDANNIEVSNSYFYVNGGYNTFDLADNYDDGKHFNGYFPVSEGNPSLDYNCFTEDGNAISPVYDITWGISGDPVSFTFNNDCNAGEGSGYSSKTQNNFILVPITDEYNDTIFIKEGTYTLSASDSMFIEMRKRNYAGVISIARSILENSPDIPEATDAVSKLYLASLRLDSTGSRIAPLKTFLEELILDNGDNAGLVSRAFYFIQKCKAALGDYSSAMAGFEDIVNNNPNTYEALVSSWDYSATALLMNGGSSGGNRPIISSEWLIDNVNEQEGMFKLNSFNDDPDDRNGFSKEEKKQIRTNVIKTFEETRKEEINLINKLKERSDRGDRNAGKELKRRELIQAVVKKRQPADIYEHINSVSSDIKTIFNATGDNALKNEQNTMPSEYELSQNFPNPFNPVTKIQFALPQDGKVQMVIYDILGREVVKLVNNEFRTAGRYVSEFNGSRLASGVYFYRISVDDGKAFNMVKKMVLIK